MKPALSIAIALLISAAASAQAPAIDPKADAALKEMGKTLADAKTMTLTSHSSVDTFHASGQKVQVSRSQEVSVRRPNGVAANVVGDDLELKFVYDGKQVLMVNQKEKSFALAEAKPTIDATLDMLATEYGLPMPLADVLYADPYTTLIQNVRSGVHLGTGLVMDIKCDHLAFRQDGIDWQVWIEQGAQRVPRKIVITYKDAPGSPQYTAYLTNWKLNADIPADRFMVEAPKDMKRVDLVRTAQEAKPPIKE